MKLYLLRHGETVLNQKKVYYGSTDCALTAVGEKQARSLRAPLADIPFDAVWVSPLSRAVKTAKLILGEDEKNLMTDERLSEVAFGEWEGKSWQELEKEPLYQKWCDDWMRTRPPGGESFADMAQRVSAFYREEFLSFRGENVLIVSHHAVLRQLVMLLLDLEKDAFWRFSFAQGAYSVFDIHDGYAVFTGHNLPGCADGQS